MTMCLHRALLSRENVLIFCILCRRGIFTSSSNDGVGSVFLGVEKDSLLSLMACARAEVALVTAITALCLSVRTACPDIYEKGTPNTRGDV